jgi:hypothetical protein
MLGPLGSTLRRGLCALSAGAALLALAACNDPNDIGVQDYGTIYGTVLTVKNAPIEGALVSAAGYQARTNAAGGFTLRVPIGQQTVTVNAAGFKSASVDVDVLKNQSAPVTTPSAYWRLSPSVAAPDAVAPVLLTPVPAPHASAAPSGAPAPSPSPTPSP